MYRALMLSRENIWGGKIDKINREQNEIDFIYKNTEELTTVTNVDLIFIEWSFYNHLQKHKAKYHFGSSKTSLVLDERDCLLLPHKELKSVDGVIGIKASETEIIQFIKLIIDGNQVIHNSIKKALETTTPLTMQEANILHLMSQGLSNREIASSLFVSPGTVKSYSSRLYRKLKVKNRKCLELRVNGIKLH
ncbi:MAG: LuxR C-terminal-related transcriptional regulator [Firmicutes bacterium]|nr:LuxR C-terminal-related transcriptional regulator [Bacillota bacterium]